MMIMMMTGDSDTELSVTSDITHRPARHTRSSDSCSMKMATRRVLFPPDDHEQFDPQAVAQEINKQLDEQDQEVWNFHFRDIRPLEGRWQWLNGASRVVTRTNIPVDESTSEQYATTVTPPATTDPQEPGHTSGSAMTSHLPSNATDNPVPNIDSLSIQETSTNHAYHTPLSNERHQQ